MNRSEYTIVIATRNRPAALRLSIPRMLAQSRPPSQLVVIDSSDDHAATAAAVEECAAGHPLDLVIREGERGLTRQRNAGLDLVRHPLAFFPDDDSIWFPDTAAEKLEVYERDEDELIAAVCGNETRFPPDDWHSSSEPASYHMSRGHRLRQRIGGTRTRLERRVTPDPARTLGQAFCPPERDLPEWFGERDVVPVEWMTGFRMSFRTEVIRRVRFDEALSRYSLFEDIDASLGAWRRGLVVAALRARVHHYRSPERRDAGRRLGVEQLANKAYIVCKHSEPGAAARGHIRPFARYKLLQYRLGAHDAFGRERLQGARAAFAELPDFVTAPSTEAPALYRDAMARLLETPAACPPAPGAIPETCD